MALVGGSDGPAGRPGDCPGLMPRAVWDRQARPRSCPFLRDQDLVPYPSCVRAVPQWQAPWGKGQVVGGRCRWEGRQGPGAEGRSQEGQLQALVAREGVLGWGVRVLSRPGFAGWSGGSGGLGRRDCREGGRGCWGCEGRLCAGCPEPLRATSECSLRAPQPWEDRWNEQAPGTHSCRPQSTASLPPPSQGRLQHMTRLSQGPAPIPAPPEASMAPEASGRPSHKPALGLPTLEASWLSLPLLKPAGGPPLL